MAVLIEAKGRKRDGTAYLPYEGLAKQRISVEVVDRDWLQRHWKEIKSSHLENERLTSLQRLKQAVDGKSSSAEDAAIAAARLSEPVQKFKDEVAAEYAAGGFYALTPGTVWQPPSPGQMEAASEFILGLIGEPHALFAAEVTRGLSRVKLCLWLDKEGQRQLGLFCPDLLSAIYAITTEGLRIAACLRCGNVFLRDRSDNQFCKERCKNTYLTANRRRREKDRASRHRAA